MAQAELNAPAHLMTGQNSPPVTDSTPEQPAEEIAINPQVTDLQAIFPDFEPIILQSVLDSVNGNQEKAIDKLLGMSDPEYKEQHSTNADQTGLDEEFARNLLIQEHEEESRRRRQQQWDVPQEPVPYQQRAYAPGQNPSGTNTNMQEVTDTFNKLAESGKKTFATLFSKVKAKIQELDQPRPDPGSPSTGNSGGFFPGAPSHQDRHTMMTQAHYQQSPTTTQPVRGYDMTYQSSPTPAPEQPPTTFSIKPDQRAPSPEITLGSNHSNQQASNIDPAKLGILPKRPVTLGGSSSPQRRSTDELEYAENPFEDGRHK
ncbi:hypothetical protein BDM02DRAFT_3265126 [Thelephora ganbajun]|uniref:Uncharacterized protein n=1 Tax=Thelephora ganbajun TaxID=370292 RepID=A0ACB6ZX22_THEGA|nr:hypothetical protein BDM02DRAFT_3265126 [Thelephora ganbajun]